MKTNEKAVAAGTGQTAQEINQLHYHPDYGNCQYPVDPVIPEMIEITKRLHELRDKGTLHYLQFDTYTGEPKIYMQVDTFFKLFSFGEYGPHATGEWDQVSTTVQGVEFFCLIEKEAKRDV